MALFSPPSSKHCFTLHLHSKYTLTSSLPLRFSRTLNQPLVPTKVSVSILDDALVLYVLVSNERSWSYFEQQNVFRVVSLTFFSTFQGLCYAIVWNVTYPRPPSNVTQQAFIEDRYSGYANTIKKLDSRQVGVRFASFQRLHAHFLMPSTRPKDLLFSLCFVSEFIFLLL